MIEWVSFEVLIIVAIKSLSNYSYLKYYFNVKKRTIWSHGGAG